jgi:hypothetical protein
MCTLGCLLGCSFVVAQDIGVLTAMEHALFDERVTSPSNLGIADTSTPFFSKASVTLKSAGSNVFWAQVPIPKSDKAATMQKPRIFKGVSHKKLHKRTTMKTRERQKK